MAGTIRVGIGGWTYPPWRGVFYPEGLPHKRELAFASRAMTTIEINGTFYSTFKPASWRKWRDETPDDFVFSVKASRYCTNRKVLAEAGSAIARFLGQGLSELGEKLGPINWQLAPTKRFDPEDVAAFLALLPDRIDGRPLRHAIEARHASFATPAFYDLARQRGIAIVHARGSDYPEIDEATAPFTYARIMSTRAKLKDGIAPATRSALTKTAQACQRRGDVFLYFIAGAKERNPAAARSLLRKLDLATVVAPEARIRRRSLPAVSGA